MPDEDEMYSENDDEDLFTEDDEEEEPAPPALAPVPSVSSTGSVPPSGSVPIPPSTAAPPPVPLGTPVATFEYFIPQAAGAAAAASNIDGPIYADPDAGPARTEAPVQASTPARHEARDEGVLQHLTIHFSAVGVPASPVLCACVNILFVGLLSYLYFSSF